MSETYKSPRKIAEEIRDYKRKRFEDYMGMVERGELSMELALIALKEEMEQIDE